MAIYTEIFMYPAPNDPLRWAFRIYEDANRENCILDSRDLEPQSKDGVPFTYSTYEKAQAALDRHVSERLNEVLK